MRGAAIEIYNPSDSEGSDGDYECLCCGQDSHTAGMCLQCVWVDCSAEFDEECERTGAVDPLDLSVSMIGLSE